MCGMLIPCQPGSAWYRPTGPNTARKWTQVAKVTWDPISAADRAMSCCVSWDSSLKLSSWCKNKNWKIYRFKVRMVLESRHLGHHHLSSIKEYYCPMLVPQIHHSNRKNSASTSCFEHAICSPNVELARSGLHGWNQRTRNKHMELQCIFGEKCVQPNHRSYFIARI